MGSRRTVAADELSDEPALDVIEGEPHRPRLVDPEREGRVRFERIGPRRVEPHRSRRGRRDFHRRSDRGNPVGVDVTGRPVPEIFPRENAAALPVDDRRGEIPLAGAGRDLEPQRGPERRAARGEALREDLPEPGTVVLLADDGAARSVGEGARHA